MLPDRSFCAFTSANREPALQDLFDDSLLQLLMIADRIERDDLLQLVSSVQKQLDVDSAVLSD